MRALAFLLLGLPLAAAADPPKAAVPGGDTPFVLKYAPVPESSPESLYLPQATLRLAPPADGMPIIVKDPALYPMIVAHANPQRFPIRVIEPRGSESPLVWPSVRPVQ